MSDWDIAILIRQLVAINSANPSTCEEGCGEAEIALFCTRWLEAHGVRARIESSASHTDRPAVVAVSEGREPGPTVLLLGHLDTFTWYQPSGWSGDGRIEGPGAFDMKGGLAAILYALLAIESRPHRGKVLALLVPDEEHTSFGVRAFAPSLNVDAAIVAEGTSADIGTRHDGRIRAFVPTNTVRDRDRLLWSLAMMARTGERALYGVSVAMLGAATPGLIAQRKIAPGERASHLAENLDAVLRSLANSNLQWEIRESFLADEDGALYACVKRHAPGARTAPVSGWTEAGVLAAAGVPCIVFGPHGGAAHTSSEWVDVRSAAQVARVLAEASLDFCGQSHADG